MSGRYVNSPQGLKLHKRELIEIKGARRAEREATESVGWNELLSPCATADHNCFSDHIVQALATARQQYNLTCRGAATI